MLMPPSIPVSPSASVWVSTPASAAVSACVSSSFYTPLCVSMSTPVSTSQRHPQLHLNPCDTVIISNIQMREQSLCTQKASAQDLLGVSVTPEPPESLLV